jgi:hypothetical protein
VIVALPPLLKVEVAATGSGLVVRDTYSVAATDV